MQVLYPGHIGIWKCWFLWREENRGTWRKTLRARQETENQQQIQPTFDTGSESNLGHIGGRQALSSLCHPCTINLSHLKKGKLHTYLGCYQSYAIKLCSSPLWFCTNISFSPKLQVLSNSNKWHIWQIRRNFIVIRTGSFVPRKRIKKISS